MPLYRFALALTVVVLAPQVAGAAQCPRVLTDATRLAVVSAPDMDTGTARLRTFARADPSAAWKESGVAQAVVIGKRGLGWGHPFAALAQPGEPVKREGDKRTPAGIYRLGATFGFSADDRAGHLHLSPGRQYCVDDVRSPDYGLIVDRSDVARGTSGEDMGAEPLYERGIVIAYPPNAAAKAGSCIFVHIWADEDVGTAGCVALPAAGVARLQDWAHGHKAAIAILSQDAMSRFAGCLPQ